MNMFSLLGKKEQPTAKEIEDNFDGNLCRCTGYRPILTAFGKFAKGGSCAGKATAANANVMASLSNPQAMRDYTPQPLHFSNEDTGMEYETTKLLFHSPLLFFFFSSFSWGGLEDTDGGTALLLSTTRGTGTTHQCHLESFASYLYQYIYGMLTTMPLHYCLMPSLPICQLIKQKGTTGR